MHKVSIILPVFNESEYLDQCLESIINQSFTNIEVIIVDDGSTDQSLEICQRYLDQDSRVKLVYQNHQGSASARNNGLTHASGDLVTFINAGDRVEQNFVQDLVDQLDRADSDIAVTFYKLYDESQGQFLLLLDPNPGEDKYDGCCLSVEWMQQIGPQLKELATSIWGKMYKRSLFTDFEFENDLHFCQDEMAWWQLCLAASKISFQNKINYTLRINKEGDSLTPSQLETQAHEKVKCLEEQITLMAVMGIDTGNLTDELRNALSNLAQKALEVSNYNDYNLAQSDLNVIAKYLPK